MLLYNLTEAGFKSVHPVWFLFLVAGIETPFILQGITQTVSKLEIRSPNSERSPSRRPNEVGTPVGQTSR
jgi:hypothetical protein